MNWKEPLHIVFLSARMGGWGKFKFPFVADELMDIGRARELVW